MKLLRIEIEEFGKLHAFCAELGPGLTLIEGPNESGKSTLLAFLRFALYGFPRKSAAEGDERAKRLSFRGRRAAGRLFLSDRGEEYCVYRAVSAKGRGNAVTEECHVTKLPHGEEVLLGEKTPGEYFLGLPLPLYDSTLCARQTEICRVGRDGIGERISALLGDDESASTEAAIKKIEALRVELLHKNGHGGRIVTLQTQEAALHESLRATRASLAEIVDQIEQKNAAEAALEEKTRQKALLERHAARARAERDLQLLKDLDVAQKNWEAAKAEHEALAARPRPISAEAAAEIRTQITAKRESERRLLALRAEKPQASRLTEQSPKPIGRSPKRRGFLLSLIPDFLLVFGGILLLLPSGPWLPGALLCAAGFTIRIALMLWKKRTSSQTADDATDPQDEVLSAWSDALARAEQEDAECTQALAQSLLREFSLDRAQPDPAEALLEQAEREAQELTQQLALSESRLQYAAEGLTAIKARTAGIDRAALLALLKTEEEPLPEQDADTTPQTLEFEIQALFAKVRQLSADIAAAKARIEDEETLNRRLYACERALEQAKQQHSTCLLALSALQKAGQELRNGIAPRLRTRTDEIFTELTGGTHGTLSLRQDLGLQIDDGGMPRAAELFSVGCADAASLALRIALAENLSETPLPLLQDEPLAHFDDARAAVYISLLQKFCAGGGQCLLFTCHTREAALLSSDPSVKRIVLNADTPTHAHSFTP